MMDRARLAELNRLLELKRLLNDGKLTREEFEALKQKELQADGTDRGSDRGSDCASERPASPAPVILTAPCSVFSFFFRSPPRRGSSID